MSKKIKEILEILYDESVKKNPDINWRVEEDENGDVINVITLKTKHPVKSLKFDLEEGYIIEDNCHKMRKIFQDWSKLFGSNVKRIEKIKEFVKDNFKNYNGGLFFTENVLGDRVELLEEIDDVGIYGCDQYSYLEIYDLDDEEENELLKYYNELRNAKNR